MCMSTNMTRYEALGPAECIFALTSYVRGLMLVDDRTLWFVYRKGRRSKLYEIDYIWPRSANI